MEETELFALVALMDLGFSSHAFHSSSRLVFMTASLGTQTGDTRKLTITTPPNNRVYPPGPGTEKSFKLISVDSFGCLKSQLIFS